jgi:hypothetical protein
MRPYACAIAIRGFEDHNNNLPQKTRSGDLRTDIGWNKSVKKGDVTMKSRTLHMIAIVHHQPRGLKKPDLAADESKKQSQGRHTNSYLIVPFIDTTNTNIRRTR